MDDVTYRKLDLAIKSVSTVLVVITIAVGIQQYERTTERDYQKTFWEKRLELYLEVSKIAATLATTYSDDDKRKAEQRFAELFHGDLVIVEDQEVWTALQKYRSRLLDYEGDSTVQDDVLGCVRDLAMACRESLKQSWDVPLKQFSNSSIDDAPGVTTNGSND